MGTEEFWVPAVLSAVSAGTNYVNTKNAQGRQDQATIEGIKDQQDLQGKGVAAAKALTDKLARSNPNAIAAKSTGDYVNQLRRNSAGIATPNASSALAPVAGASKRYSADSVKAQQAVEQYGDTTAAQLGQLDSAVRQRQNEGLDMQDLGTQLNTLGAQSATRGFVDQLRAATAGQPNPWASLGASLVGGLANGMSSNWTPKTKVAKAPAGSLYAGPDTASDAIGALV